MPIYEYRCADCGKTFDALQKFSDETFTNCGQSSSLDCETKGKGTVTRLISSPSFHLKGTGWYATDYAKSGTTKPANASSGDSKSDSNSESKNESKSDAKSDSKGESKSDSKSESKLDSKSESKSESKSDSSTSTPASTPAKKDS